MKLLEFVSPPYTVKSLSGMRYDKYLVPSAYPVGPSWKHALLSHTRPGPVCTAASPGSTLSAL